MSRWYRHNWYCLTKLRMLLWRLKLLIISTACCSLRFLPNTIRYICVLISPTSLILTLQKLSVFVSIDKLRFSLLTLQISHQHGKPDSTILFNVASLLQLSLHSVTLHVLETLQYTIVSYRRRHFLNTVKIFLENILISYACFIFKVFKQSDLLAARDM